MRRLRQKEHVLTILPADLMSPDIRVRKEERTFWPALAVAVLMHSMLLLGFTRSLPRQMGEPDGSLEAVTVDVIDAAELMGMTQAAQSAVKAADNAAASAAPAPPSSDAEPSIAKAPDAPSATPLPIDPQVLEPFSLPKQSRTEPPSVNKREADKQANKRQPERQANANPVRPLDFSMPESLPIPSNPGTGWSGSAARPADITRSGENDDFGRGVIRALRTTMPQLRATAGQVTVRILISEKGNLSQVQLVRSSGNASLDQSVMFSVQQSSFPFPPARATLSDRTFLVTYVYR